MTVIEKEVFRSGLDYEDYVDFVCYQSEFPSTQRYYDYLHYIKLNMARMKRLHRRPTQNLLLRDRVMAVQGIKINVLIISEPWCGDAAQSIPLIYNNLKINDNFSVKVFLRDESAYLMDQFLTNGTRSIPVVVFLDENMKQLFKWGPRPESARLLFNQMSENKHLNSDDISYKLQTWYNTDKGNSVETELLKLMLELLRMFNYIK